MPFSVTPTVVLITSHHVPQLLLLMPYHCSSASPPDLIQLFCIKPFLMELYHVPKWGGAPSMASFGFWQKKKKHV
jgi:hypothetical protein